MKEGITDELSYVLPHYVDNAGFLLDDTEEFNWVRAYEGHILDVYYKDIEERTESYRQVTTERMTEICREVFRQSNILLTVKGKKKRWILSGSQKFFVMRCLADERVFRHAPD